MTGIAKAKSPKRKLGYKKVIGCKSRKIRGMTRAREVTLPCPGYYKTKKL